MPAIDIPRLGLGTFSSANREQWTDAVETALDLGYRHIDTAQVYGNEEYVGEGIARSSVDRDEIFLATKTVHVDVPEEPAAVPGAIDGCLERLDVEYVDLLYVHWPSGIYDHEAILPAYQEAFDDGKTRAIGLSNFTPKLLNEAREVLDAPILAHQAEMHPLLRQPELVSYAQEQDIWFVAYSPLAKGEVFEVPELQDIATKHDATPAQISLAWLLSQENVAAIPKSSTPEHMRENLTAQEIELDEHDLARIRGIKRTYRVIDPDHGPWNW